MPYTPWNIEGSYIVNAKGEDVADTQTAAIDVVPEQIAAHIVKCVNIHDELVKSVEAAIKFILARHEDGMAGDFCEQLSDVLFKAKMRA